jgi:hypothetical protein
MWISWYLNPSVLGSRHHSAKVFLTTPKNFVIGAFAFTFKSFLQSFTLKKIKEKSYVSIGSGKLEMERARLDV